MSGNRRLKEFPMTGQIGSLETYRDALTAVFRQHGVILAYLYGSQARGDAGPLSDVDIAVLFGRDLTKEERFRHRLQLGLALAGVLKREDVSIVDLDKATPLLKNKVRLDGKVLYSLDERLRVEFETSVFHEYIDTKPLRQSHRYYQNRRLESRLKALQERKQDYS